MLETPLYLKDEKFTRPKMDTEYFLVAQNGVFFCRNNKFFQSDVRLWGEKHHFESFQSWSYMTDWEKKEQARRKAEAEAKTKIITSLLPHEEEVIYLFPPLKKRQLQKIVGFFDWVYKKCHSESIILLYWDLKNKRYHYFCPDQTVSSWDCKYKSPLQLPPNCLQVGSIHSHCNMEAHFSGTDEKDEQYADGVHAIVGRLRDDPPQFAASLIVDGRRFSIDEDQFMEPYEFRDEDFPEDWKPQVKTYSYAPANNSKPGWLGGWFGSGSQGSQGTSPDGGKKRKIVSQYGTTYIVDANEEAPLEVPLEGIEEETHLEDIPPATTPTEPVKDEQKPFDGA